MTRTVVSSYELPWIEDGDQARRGAFVVGTRIRRAGRRRHLRLSPRLMPLRGRRAVCPLLPPTARYWTCSCGADRERMLASRRCSDVAGAMIVAIGRVPGAVGSEDLAAGQPVPVPRGGGPGADHRVDQVLTVLESTSASGAGCSASWRVTGCESRCSGGSALARRVSRPTSSSQAAARAVATGRPAAIWACAYRGRCPSVAYPSSAAPISVVHG